MSLGWAECESYDWLSEGLSHWLSEGQYSWLSTSTGDWVQGAVWSVVTAL